MRYLFGILVVMMLAIGLGIRSHQARAATAITHVVLIMEENKSSTATIGHMPYLDSLRTKYTQLTNYWATNYPSNPNYMQLTSGKPVPGSDCVPSGGCQSTNNNIFNQGSWKVLAESMPSNCAKSNSGEYVPRHTAAPYYTDLTNCKTNDVPYNKATTPNISSAFTLIAPNLIDDMHDGSLAQGNSWLQTVVPKILNSAQFQSGNTLVEITFDSGSANCGSNCQSHVEAVLINPQITGKSLSTKYTHDSLLRLNEELLNYPLLGGAASAPDIRPALGL